MVTANDEFTNELHKDDTQSSARKAPRGGSLSMREILNGREGADTVCGVIRAEILLCTSSFSFGSSSQTNAHRLLKADVLLASNEWFSLRRVGEWC